MKLLFVIRDAHGWAGTERVLNLVANAISDRYEIEILSLSPRPFKDIGYSFNKEIRCMYLPVSSGAFGLAASNFRIASYVAHGGYNVVVLAGVGEIKYFLLVALRHASKLVAWEHFNAALTYRRFNRRFAARFCDAIIVLTAQDLEDWKRLLQPRAQVFQIPNPVPQFPERAATLKTKRILALGRLEDQKRFDRLLLAFADFCHAHPDWTLRIRGSGSKRESLISKAAELGLKDNVEILGPTSAVDAEYANAAIYAMSSKFEGFPMTLLEAMASGVPCVSFACPNGPSEIIRDGEDGFLVRSEDVAELAERLGRLADNKTLRERMGIKARENIKRYDIGVIVEDWIDVLGKLCP